MESLYTKYRPQTFADVVGQEHVVTTLEHAVLEERTSHAYLFCGPRGTGKTTMARLLAKALMCEQGAGHLPDGTCDQCRMIATGEHPDVYELDAASRTGVDNVREEIISRVSFAPVRAPYKMYIIDEVHMLTVAAFNALLKTLEEPPSHVVFVLCTTDPQKIPETILSRVQRFDFHSIGRDDIQARLTYICEREGFSFDPEALELVVRHARGGMRDAISELEQLSVSGGGSITVDVARDVLGEVSASTLERMSLAMANRDVPSLFAQVESLVEAGRDLLQFTRALAARLRDVYVVTAIGNQSSAVSAAQDELPALSREAKAFGSADRVSRALSLLSDASTEMRVAPNQRLVLEVALTKVARPQSELTLEALADRVAALERQMDVLSTPAARRQQASAELASGQCPSSSTPPVPAVEPEPEAKSTLEHKPALVSDYESEPVPASESAPVSASSTQASPAQVRAAAPEPAREPVPEQAPDLTPKPASEPAAAPARDMQEAAPRQEAPEPAASQASDQPPVEAESRQAAPEANAPQQPPASHERPTPQAAVMDAGELQRRWKQVVDGLLAAHPQHGSLLMSATALSDDGEVVTVAFPRGSSFACRMLERSDVRANVDPVVDAVFGPRKAVFVEGGAKSPSSSPAARTSEPAQHAAPIAPAREHGTQPGHESSPQAQSQPQAQPDPQPQPQAQAQSDSQPDLRPQAQPDPQPAYPAPWEPAAADEPVPYDDLDAAPYEEDLAFVPDASADGGPAPVPAPTAAPAPATTPVTPASVPQEPAAAEPPSQQAPAPDPASAPDPALAAVQSSAPAASPSQSTAAPTEAPKRTRRAPGTIPADIVSMMTEIFGEGVTYTAEPAPDEVTDEPATGLDAHDEPTSHDGGYDTESEFVEEPVDDADFDAED